MRMKAIEAAEAMVGKADNLDSELVFTGVSTDTRTIRPGDMFIAIKGENFDGSDYIDSAFEKGAVCAVSARESDDKRIIAVDDAVKALGRLARYHRKKFNIPVIAVTGSVGKTTVKNMLISVLSQKYMVHSTKGNLNNHIGLPMTLMTLSEEHQVSVLEMGMSDLGEIDYLASIARPDYGVINNIGTAHIGILGSRENILKAKTEIMNYMKPGDTLVLNGDDELLVTVEKPGLNIVYFGTKDNSQYKAEMTRSDETGNCIFESEGTLFQLPIAGSYNAVNAMAAVAMGRLMGLNEEMIQKGLKDFSQSKMRMYRYTHEGVNYINDAYNANPQSMKAALDILKGSSGRRIAAMGDMLEMGDYSESEHVKTGEYAAGCADILVLCGEEAENMKKGALGINSKLEIHTFATSAEAKDILSKLVRPKDTVLVKGSRGMKMENMLEYTKDGGNE